MRAPCLAAAALLLSGCAADAVTTVIRVRHPGRVSVEAADGSKVLLPRIVETTRAPSSLYDADYACSSVPPSLHGQAEGRVCRDVDRSISFDLYGSYEQASNSRGPWRARPSCSREAY